jgi:Cadherin domain
MLDREVRGSVLMEIQAVEKVKPHNLRDKNSGIVHVEVSLLDANDNTPQFQFGNLYEFKIDATAKIGHVIGHIRATDPDEGVNGMIIYELQRPPGPNIKAHLPFKLDALTGALIVNDHLQKGRIAFFVEASDQPTNPSERRFSLAVVTVDVVHQLEENELEFIGAPYEFYIGSDAQIGTSVGQVKINLDWESNEEIMFDLLHSYSEGVPFAVEERSGIVTVIRSLDDFTRQNYEFEAVVAFINQPSENATNYAREQSFRQLKAHHGSRKGRQYDLDQPTVMPNFDNVMVTNLTVHVVDSSEGKKIFVRGTNNDSLVFHVRENLPNTLIGQLLTKDSAEAAHQLEKNDIVLGENSRGDRQLSSSTRYSRPRQGRGRSKRSDLDDDEDLDLDEAKYVRKKVIRRMKALELDRSRDIAAKDSNMELRFLIANQQDVRDLIRITDDGSLMTVQGLDREVASTYRLTVIAEFSKGFYAGAGIYQVTIIVDDVNDNAPTFNRNSYKGIIAENAQLGTELLMNHVIRVTDKDSEENGNFVVSLQGEGSNFFVLEKVNKTKNSKSYNDLKNLYQKYNMERSMASANLMFFDTNEQADEGPYYMVRFTGPSALDRERDNMYELKLVARDSGGLHSEATLMIMILDVNDNGPVFEKIAVFKHSGIEILQYTDDMEVYFVDLMDNTLNATTAEVKKTTGADYVRYTNSGKSKDNAGDAIYKFDRIPALAYNSAPIGTPRNFEKDRSNLSRSARASKNKEEFPLFAILESIAVGVPVVKITATDSDSDGNSQIFYAIESEFFVPNKVTPRQMNTIKYFSIDRLSGEVKVNRPLPAESEIRLNISAKDIGGLSDHTTIRFKVIDINDHPPIFKKPWHTFDVEEGVYSKMHLGTIQATDEDFGSNANITYTIHALDKLPFEVVPGTGDLKVSGILDREKKSVYEFKIVATDNSDRYNKLSSVAEVEVNVLDLNDNAPEFTGYDEMFVAEDMGEGMSRKLSNVEDLDSNYNDREVKKLPVYKAYLNRRTEPGTLVKQITALDKDFTGNGNGLVMYALEQRKMPYNFEIDSRSGVITTASRLNAFNDYEHVNITVIASDLGSPSLSASAMILINLQGEQDHEESVEADPTSMFLHKYFEVDVRENNPVPLKLLQINMSSNYADEVYKWQIVPEMEILKYAEFSIDPQNGTLWLDKSLDREKKDVFKLKVRAEKVTREGRNIPMMMYPIVGERVNGLQDNEVRVSWSARLCKPRS